MTKIRPELSNLSNGAKRGAKPPVGLPPQPGQIVCGTIDMRIDSQGRWHYQGSQINRLEMVKLFSSVLRRDDDGDYWLITPAEMCKIEVEDAPFQAVELRRHSQGHDQDIHFRINIGDLVSLDDTHPLRVEIDEKTNEPSPYIALDNGLEAKLTRSVFYELVDLGNSENVDGRQFFGIWSKGLFFPIGATPYSGF